MKQEQKAKVYFLLAQAAWEKARQEKARQENGVNQAHTDVMGQAYEGVMTKLKQSLALASGDIETLLLMTEVANEHGDYEEAHTYYVQAAALAQQSTRPNNGIFQIKLAALSAALGQEEDAKQAHEQQAKADTHQLVLTDQSASNVSLDHSVQDMRQSGLEHQLLTLLEIEHRTPETQLQIGHIYYTLGEIDKARDAYQKGLDLVPPAEQDSRIAIGLLHNLGIAFWRKGEYDEALRRCERAIALKSDFAQGWNSKGLALYGKREFQEALKAFDEAIRIAISKATPEDPLWRFYENRALVYDAMGESGKAKEDRKEAKKLRGGK